ncbi:hydantoin racemase [Gluconacetobacter liquefaciens]|uniref:Allantoin racemase n=1 Tax=Gluconacetobacter liquefaciens TaxID=89584 RepID=A0A370G0C3_GLULI|nr:aspartate/glutamate racemase family protein [Gluconacetobacter liquefaciens]MBB2188304.1 hydantoin racemase [Gluconacetobacter liquefaciens]RDI36339.1 allantoin racemase [Gluconacetobacter liquefaciens]GEB39589.1 hydantoin racemase [Gluconacetobacter liquefaciens]
MIKVLWINPVSDSGQNAGIARELAAIRQPGTEIHVCSLDLGDLVLSSIGRRAPQSAVWFPIVSSVYHAQAEGIDAIAIGCFYDTALDEAREVSGSAIVCAPCHSALEIATRLCHRVSIIIADGSYRVQMEETIRKYGLSHRIASFRAIDATVESLQQDGVATYERLRRVIGAAIVEDGAEGIVLGCTSAFGYAVRLREEFGIPVVDCQQAAFKCAEFMGRAREALHWLPSRKGSCQAPTKDFLEQSGLFGKPSPLAGRIVVPAV